MLKTAGNIFVMTKLRISSMGRKNWRKSFKEDCPFIRICVQVEFKPCHIRYAELLEMSLPMLAIEMNLQLCVYIFVFKQLVFVYFYSAWKRSNHLISIAGLGEDVQRQGPASECPSMAASSTDIFFCQDIFLKESICGGICIVNLMCWKSSLLITLFCTFAFSPEVCDNSPYPSAFPPPIFHHFPRYCFM